MMKSLIVVWIQKAVTVATVVGMTAYTVFNKTTKENDLQDRN